LQALFESVSGRVFGSKFTKGGHIWRPILRKVCERKLLVMVWVEKKSIARWLEKAVMEEFLCRFCSRALVEGFSGQKSQREVIYGDLFLGKFVNRSC
jgi:hypothetical protein